MKKNYSSFVPWVKVGISLKDWIRKYGIKEFHIATAESATFKNFSSLIDKLAKKVDEDDLVVIGLDGHGSSDGFFSFADKGIHYSEIGKQLQKLRSKVVVLIDSCYSGISIPYLSSPSRVIMTQVNAGQISWGPELNIHVARAFVDVLAYKKADLNDDGYINFHEAFKFAKTEIRPVKTEGEIIYRDPQISNPELANQLYLIEKFVKED